MPAGLITARPSPRNWPGSDEIVHAQMAEVCGIVEQYDGILADLIAGCARRIHDEEQFAGLVAMSGRVKHGRMGAEPGRSENVRKVMTEAGQRQASGVQPLIDGTDCFPDVEHILAGIESDNRVELRAGRVTRACINEAVAAGAAVDPVGALPAFDKVASSAAIQHIVRVAAKIVSD